MKILGRDIIIAALLFTGLVGSVTAMAGQALNVAVAANFAPAMEQIISLFTAETGIPVQMTVSSTGRLYAQIKNKAPYDLYYAADVRRPELLFAEGLCSEPRRYATGKVVLWSGSEKMCLYESWEDVVTGGGAGKIAVANPEIAPYGYVARETMEKKHMVAALSKLVYGSNVGQSFQYASMGAVDAAFIAMSLARTEKGKEGCFWRIPEAAGVEQKACLTMYGRNVDAARQFLEFTLSDKVVSVREQFGYSM